VRELRARLAALNPAAPVLNAAAGEATAERLIGCGLFDPQRKSPDVRRWLAEEAYSAAAPHGAHAHHRHDPNRHDARIRAFTLASDRPIPAASFEMFIDLLRSLHGPKLLRLKGIVQIAEEPELPLVIHGVQHVMHPAVRLDRWPDEDRRTRIVLITRDLSAGEVQPLFDAFLNRSAPDQPDRAALLDNPLVPFGGRDR
jgi:G3E family GTPase